MQSETNSDANIQTSIKSEPPDADFAVCVDSDFIKQDLLPGAVKSDPSSLSYELLHSDHCYAIEKLHKAWTGLTGAGGSRDSDVAPDTRTLGRRYVCGDTEYDTSPSNEDERLLNVIVRIRAPLTAVPSRLVIPMIRVPRAKMMMEKSIEMDTIDSK